MIHTRREPPSNRGTDGEQPVRRRRSRRGQRPAQGLGWTINRGWLKLPHNSFGNCLVDIWLPQGFEDTVACDGQLDGVRAERGGANGLSRARSSGHAQLYMTHASERGAAARKSRRVSRIARQESKSLSYLVLTTHVQHVLSAKARSR